MFSWREPAIVREQEWRRRIQKMARQPGILFDLGGGTPYQGYISIEDVGPRTKYFSLDIAREARPHVVANVTRLPLAASSVNYVLCNAVLEHVREPDCAVQEIRRVLKARGQVMVSVPFIYPYHDRVDYYRFTDTALRHLFRSYSQLEIVPVGDYVYTALLFITGFNFRLVRWLSPLLISIRLMLTVLISLYNKFAPEHKRRDYFKSLTKSPVGWYIYGTK